jgi:hypothetical protein
MPRLKFVTIGMPPPLAFLQLFDHPEKTDEKLTLELNIPFALMKKSKI